MSRAVTNPRIQSLIIFFVMILCFKGMYYLLYEANPISAQIPILKTKSFAAQESNPFYLSIIEARTIIPESSLINLSPSGVNVYRLFAQWLLYPLTVSQNWSYFIDFDHSISHRHPSWRMHRLSTGVPIYMKPGFQLMLNKPIEDPYSASKVIITFFIIVTLSFGFWLVMFNIFIDRNVSGGWIWVWATVYIFGIFFLMVVLWTLLFLGGALERNILLGLWIFSVILLLIVLASEYKDRDNEIFK